MLLRGTQNFLQAYQEMKYNNFNVPAIFFSINKRAETGKTGWQQGWALKYSEFKNKIIRIVTN